MPLVFLGSIEARFSRFANYDTFFGLLSRFPCNDASTVHAGVSRERLCVKFLIGLFVPSGKIASATHRHQQQQQPET